jgi:hypothetical protein
VRKTIKDRAKLEQMLATAEENMQVLAEAFETGDMNDEQFKWACDLATKCAIAKAAITSLEAMR